MGVMKEYFCFAHGEFEAEQPVCPAGCTTNIEREYRTAPAARSGKTKATDAALERLAQRFGYSDLSNRGGSVAASQPQKPEMDFRPRWEAVPKGHAFHAGGRIEERDGAVGGAEKPAGEYGSGRAVGPSLGMPAELMATKDVPLPTGAALPRPRPHVVAQDKVSGADFDKAMRAAT